MAKGSALAEAARRRARRAAELRAAIERAGGIYLADRLHRVRVAAKKLRYALEIQRELTQFAIDRAVEPLEGAAGPARPHARPRDPDRSRPRRAGRADAARSPRHGRAEEADPRARRRVPRRSRRLHARPAGPAQAVRDRDRPPAAQVRAPPPPESHTMAATIELYLVRHAIAAERGPKYPDDRLRPLTPAGSKKFAESVPGLIEMDVVIDFVLTSPLVRARDTAMILAAGLKPKPAVDRGRGAGARRPPAGDHRGDQDAREAPSAAGAGRSRAGSRRAGGAAAGRRGGVEFKKGGVCLIEVDGATPARAGHAALDAARRRPCARSRPDDARTVIINPIAGPGRIADDRCVRGPRQVRSRRSPLRRRRPRHHRSRRCASVCDGGGCQRRRCGRRVGRRRHRQRRGRGAWPARAFRSRSFRRIRQRPRARSARSRSIPARAFDVAATGGVRAIDAGDLHGSLVLQRRRHRPRCAHRRTARAPRAIAAA